MDRILLCEIGCNWSLGQALGNDRHSRCWAVQMDTECIGSLAYGEKYFKRFNTFQEAEKFVLEREKKSPHSNKMRRYETYGAGVVDQPSPV